MQTFTGQTIFENIISCDLLNNPVPAATFDIQLYKDDTLVSDIDITGELTDNQRAIFTFSFSAATLGSYQLYAKNNITSVIYLSEIYDVVEDEKLNIFVGL